MESGKTATIHNTVISIPLLTVMITNWLVCSFFASHGIMLVSTQNTDITCTGIV
jgi:uncharacterized membrane protein